MHILAACSHVVDIFNTLRKGHVDSSGGFVLEKRVVLGGSRLKASGWSDRLQKCMSRCSGSWRSYSVVSSKALIFSRVTGQDREPA